MRKRIIGALATTMLATTAAIAPSIAASPTSDPAPKKADHCWTNLDTGEGGCFDTLEASVASMTKGKVELQAAPTTVSQSLVDEIEVSAPAATYVLGTFYASRNYSSGLGSYMVTASSGCDTDPDVDHNMSVMPSGWNDRIGSFKSYANCATKLYEHGGFTGTTYGYYINSADPGIMYKQASSVRWN